MILGTAGHIDHGKTALVKALTGVDTDRLPEEKKRGITIDLGFAPLRLGDEVMGVVDVPGHEGFVRTMLAGATGIDIALLVIAADEGPMPQTLEHLAILELLDVEDVIVALTKADLVDNDWLTLVTEDVRQLLTRSSLELDGIYPTSVVTGKGIPELRESLHGFAKRGPAIFKRAHDDIFRMPVDRVFTVKGTGTVVTGTVWSGELAMDATVRILPEGKTARVRSLQNHGEAVEKLELGMRAAIALAGVNVDDIARGSTLVTLPAWQPTQVIRADVTLLPDAPTLRPRTKVRFHLATSDVGARIVATGAPIEAGQTRPVKIILDAPVVARAEDRFVLRSSSPVATIGGGVITDPMAPRRGKPFPKSPMPAGEGVHWIAAEAGLHGIPVETLPVRFRTPELHDFSKIVTKVADRWYSPGALDDARSDLLAIVRKHHNEKPLDPGTSREDVRSRLGADAAVFDQIVAGLVARKKLEAAGAVLRLPGRAAELSPAQEKAADQILGELTAAWREPPSVGELEQRHGGQTMSVLRHLERQKRVVQVEEGRYYAPEAVRELLGRLEAGMSGKGEVAPTDLKEVLGFSRKYLIPFLEYCDKRGYTQRRGNGRVWKGPTSKQ